MATRHLFTFTLCVLALSGCSWLKDWDGEGSRKSAKRVIQPPLIDTQMKEADLSWKQPRAEELLAGQNMPQNAPVMKPIRAKAMGSRPAMMGAPLGQGSTEDRIAALESAVMGMQADYQQMKPVFTQLLTTNERINQMLSTMGQGGGVMPSYQPQAGGMPMQARPRPQSSAQPHSMPKPMPSYTKTASTAGGAATVTGIRLGEHKRRTRLVLDMTGPTPYSYDLDNNERLLIINMPQAKWSAPQKFSPRKSSMISSYMYQPQASGGSALAVVLKRGAKITKTQALPAIPGVKSPRIFLDISEY